MEFKQKKKSKRIIHILFAVFGLMVAVGAGFLFGTTSGHDLRVLAAGTILSSQHRQYAWLSMLPKTERDRILEQIENPTYINSGESKATEELATTLKQEQAPKVLQVTVETLQKKISPAHYYEGKLMTISNPLDVKLVSSEQKGMGEQINVLAERTHALGAINAGGFVDVNGHGNGGVATGIVIQDGKVTSSSGGGEDYVAALTKAGVLISGKYSASQLIQMGAWYAAGFKPQLIVDGKKMITGEDGWGIGPRTAIGQKKDGSIVMIVIDGRQPGHSIGATTEEVQNILFDHGVVNAICMDGGSSAAMMVKSELVTIPSSVGHIPRYLPNAWVVVPTKGEQVQMTVDGKQVS